MMYVQILMLSSIYWGGGGGKFLCDHLRYQNMKNYENSVWCGHLELPVHLKLEMDVSVEEKTF